MRRWVLQAEVDAGQRTGMTSAEHAEVRKLKAENARLREDVGEGVPEASFVSERVDADAEVR